MATLEEMLGWSPAEIVLATQLIAPPGMTFEAGFDPRAGAWFARFWATPDGERRVAWEDWGIDQRTLCLNGYGWAWRQRQPKPPAHSPWAIRQREVTIPEATRTAASRVPDPADLDPDEILSVYATPPGQPRRR